jgi:hypothetical protein
MSFQVPRRSRLDPGDEGKGVSAAASNATQLDAQPLVQQTAQRAPQRRALRVAKVVRAEALPEI